MGGEELETAQLWRGSLKHFTVNGLVTGTGSVIKRIRPFFNTGEITVCLQFEKKNRLGERN